MIGDLNDVHLIILRASTTTEGDFFEKRVWKGARNLVGN